MMKSKLLAAAMISVALTGAAKTAPITYAVSLFDGTAGVGVGGSITTDGTPGPLTASNVLDWDLIGSTVNNSVPAFSFDLTGPLSGNNSQLSFLGNVLAAPLTLTFNPPLPPNPCIRPPAPGANCGTAGTIDIIGTSLSQNEIFMSVGLFNNFGTITPNSRLFVCHTVAGTNICGLGANGIPTDGVFADGKAVPTAVPGPIAGAGLPGLILAGGGLLALARRRRRQLVA
jgi:hypothetical protein